MEYLKEKRKDIHLIDVNLIDIPKHYPKRHTLNLSIADDIDINGQKEAIKVLRVGNRYILVHGFRRVMAFQLDLLQQGKTDGYILANIVSSKTTILECLKDYYISNKIKPLSSFDLFKLFLQIYINLDLEKKENTLLELTKVTKVAKFLDLKESYVLNSFRKYYKYIDDILYFRDVYDLNPNLVVKLRKKLSKDEMIEKIELCYQNELTLTYNNIMQDQAVKNVSLTKLQKLLDKNPNLTVLELKRALEENKVNSLFD